MRVLPVVVTIGFGLLGLLGASCSSSTNERGTFQEPASPNFPDEAGTNLNLGDATTAVDVTFKGTIFAPNGTLPLSNALAYVTTEPPADIPQGAYCDECVALPPDTFAVSAADGTFTFTANLPQGKLYFVVQKGQFRRVRSVTIGKDTPSIDVPKDDTTLPGRSDHARGDDVPKMAILKDSTDYDKIDESLSKLGIKDVLIENDHSMLDNETTMMDYHVIFIPCGHQDDPRAGSPQVKANLQKFVQAGGKLYVTDYSYEFVRQPFPGYLSWQGETSGLGSAITPEWDGDAIAADEGLAEWLSATGDKAFRVEGNWTTLNGVSVVPGLDPKGEPVDITPKIWMTAQKPGGAGIRPTTVSFPNQCGRVLYSTYHTENGGGAGSALLAQEKSLLYVLLEVGVCVGDRPGVH